MPAPSVYEYRIPKGDEKIRSAMGIVLMSVYEYEIPKGDENRRKSSHASEKQRMDIRNTLST